MSLITSSAMASVSMPLSLRRPGLQKSGLVSSQSSARPCRGRPLRCVASFDPSKVQPTGERVLLRLMDQEKSTAGGVLLPAQSKSGERTVVATVVAWGPEVDAGKLSQGAHVIVPRVSLAEIGTSSAGSFALIRSSELMAVVS